LTYDEAPTREDAERIAYWAAEIIAVEGGWQCFENVEDARIWQDQV